MEYNRVSIPEPPESVFEFARMFDSTQNPPTDEDLEFWNRIGPVLERDDHEQLTEHLVELTQASYVDEEDSVMLLASGRVNYSNAGHRTVQRAYTQRGVVESGGNNAGVPLQRYTRWFRYNSGPLPWCAFFVSWCLDTGEAGNRNKKVPWDNPGYVGSVYQWARGNGRLVNTPVHGDIFGSGDQHMGLVVGAKPQAGIIFTIEGNAPDRVRQVSRNYRTDKLWFARLSSDR